MHQTNLVENDGQGVDFLRRKRTIRGEQRKLLGLLLLLVKDLDGLAPGRLLAVVYLAKVQDLSLNGSSAAATTRLDDAPIAVKLAVLLP